MCVSTCRSFVLCAHLYVGTVQTFDSYVPVARTHALSFFFLFALALNDLGSVHTGVGLAVKTTNG